MRLIASRTQRVPRAKCVSKRRPERAERDATSPFSIQHSKLPIDWHAQPLVGTHANTPNADAYASSMRANPIGTHANPPCIDAYASGMRANHIGAHANTPCINAYASGMRANPISAHANTPCIDAYASGMRANAIGTHANLPGMYARRRFSVSADSVAIVLCVQKHLYPTSCRKQDDCAIGAGRKLGYSNPGFAGLILKTSI